MNDLRKVLLATLVVVAALGCGLFNWKGKKVEADIVPKSAEWMNVFPTYPNRIIAPNSIADELTFNGLPMQIAYMQTVDTRYQVENYYVGVWQSQGYEPKLTPVDDRSSSVSIVDKDMQFLTVNIADNGDYRIIMYTVSSFPESNTDLIAHQVKVFNLPLPEGGVLISDQELISSGLPSAVKMAQIPLSVADVIDFYLKVNREIGFQLQRIATEDETEMLFFSAGRVMLVLSVTAVSKVPPLSLVTVSYLEEP